MNFLIEHCLFPIIEGDECIGQGFVADGYFITAAHVVKNYPKSFVELQGKRIILSEQVPMFMGDGHIEKDSKATDVVIYYLGYFPSFLHLSVETPSKGDNLRSYCMSLKYASSNNSYYKELSIEHVSLLDQDEDNYFYCKCNRYKGSSGSPLVTKNKVVGIMHGGDGKGICAFLKPVSFMLPEVTPLHNPLIDELKKYAVHKQEQPITTSWGSFGREEEPWTPDYFNRRAREQMKDTFDEEEGAVWNID